jgi:O-antigen/teichoic acid export membrane protein
MSKLAPAETIGIASTVISLGVMFSSIASLGVPSAVQRFLGKSFAEENPRELRAFVTVSLFIISLGILGCCVAVFITQEALASLVDLDSFLVLLSILLVGSSALVVLLRSIMISVLKTKTLLITVILSSIAKFAIAVSLVQAGTNAIGLVIGFTSQHVISAVVLGAVVLMTTKFATISITELKIKSRMVFNAGLANWIPLFVSTISSQLGTVVVFGLHGAVQAGTYFMAFSVLTAVSGVMFSLFSVTFPVISGMTDGRKRLTLKIIKISLVLTLPFGSSMIFYSDELMGLLGEAYSTAALPLSILLLSLLPVAITSGISNLAYAYGRNKQVLAIGLATNLPRALLYFPLVDEAGGIGAATAFVIGSTLGLVLSIAISRRIGIMLDWKNCIVIFIVPITTNLVLSGIGVPYFVGVPLTIIFSYLALFKLRIMTPDDLKELEGAVPQTISAHGMKLFAVLRRIHML